MGCKWQIRSLVTVALFEKVALLDNDELNGVDEDSDDWSFVQLGEQQNFGIKTAGLEDKATACTMLVCYAKYVILSALID